MSTLKIRDDAYSDSSSRVGSEILKLVLDTLDGYWMKKAYLFASLQSKVHTPWITKTDMSMQRVPKLVLFFSSITIIHHKKSEVDLQYWLNKQETVWRIIGHSHLSESFRLFLNLLRFSASSSSSVSRSGMYPEGRSIVYSPISQRTGLIVNKLACCFFHVQKVKLLTSPTLTTLSECFVANDKNASDQPEVSDIRL